MTTANNIEFQVEYHPPVPPSCTGVSQVAHIEIIEEDDFDRFCMEAAAGLFRSLEESERGETLPLWFVLHAPAWLVRFAFWLKSKRPTGTQGGGT